MKDRGSGIFPGDATRATQVIIIGTVAAVLGLSAGASGAVAATRVGITQAFDDPRSPSAGDDISVEADQSDDRITVAFEPDRPAFIVRSRKRIVSADCVRLTEKTVRCGVELPSIVSVFAAGGDDRIKLRKSVRAEGLLYGGPGDDALIGDVAPTPSTRSTVTTTSTGGAATTH